MGDIIKAPLRAGGGVLAIIPQDIDQVWRIAGMAVAGSMAPKSLVDNKSFEDAQAACAIAIMAGAELGLTPLMALRSYAVVNGRPSLWGDGLKAVVRQSGKCEYIRTGSDNTKGWCEAKRSDTGEMKRIEFTEAQAKAASLWNKKGPWSDGYRDVMMERRATNRCLNDLFADVLGGLVSADEAFDSAPIDGYDEPRDITPRKEISSGPPPAPEPEEEEEDEAGGVDVIDPLPADKVSRFVADVHHLLWECQSEEAVDAQWDLLHVEAKLFGHDDALGEAFDIKLAAKKRFEDQPEPGDDGAKN